MSLFSKSPWKWTLRLLLLSSAAMVAGVVSALLHPLFGDASAAGGAVFIIVALSSCVFFAGVVGTVVSCVMERRGIMHGRRSRWASRCIDLSSHKEMGTMNAPQATRAHAALALLSAVVILAGTLALGACGGSGNSASGVPPATPSPAASYGEASPSATASGAPRMAVSYARPPGLPSPHAVTLGTVGWSFKPTVDILVTELGCFDVYQDGLARSHRVGIFDARTKRLLASVAVRPESALDGAFRWASLDTPLILKARHSYVVGTEDHRQTELNGQSVCETCYEEGSAAQWAPEIAFVELRRSSFRSGGRFAAPTDRAEIWAMIKVTWMSPNFKFVPMSNGSSSSALEAQGRPGTLVITSISEPDKNYDVCLVRSDGTGFRRLTTGAGNEEHASWSPDGTRIVYGASGPKRSGVFAMQADGSGKVYLGEGGSPSWSPDGTQVLCGGLGSLSLMNADGSGRRVVHVPFSPSYATWAPNGKIVFVRAPLPSFGGNDSGGIRYPGGDLYAVNPDGSGLERLTRHAGMILPSVSPDGGTIAAYVPKADRIIAVPYRGYGPPVTLLTRASRRLANGGQPIAHWTPDGKRLVLGSSNYGEDGGAGLYIVNADGSGLARIPGVLHAIGADWRP